ncbi:MAG: J domain-containing protein [Candidatus Acidiferrales bacterium]
MTACLRWGKYRGEDIRTIPAEYLEFILESAQETIRDCTAELERRALVEEASLSWAERIIQSGYRELARRHHPDIHGGDGEEMRAVNAAAEALRELLRGSG